MNNNRNTDIKLREKIFGRSAAEYYLKDIASSEFARGMYCCSMIKCRDKGDTLCVFLDENGKYISEIVINRDFARPHDRLLDKVRTYGEKLSASKVILARRRLPDADTEYLIAGGIVISDELQKCGVQLVAYYLTEESAYFNIIPER